jgi:hypothetical protein
MEHISCPQIYLIVLVTLVIMINVYELTNVYELSSFAIMFFTNPNPTGKLEVK